MPTVEEQQAALRRGFVNSPVGGKRRRGDREWLGPWSLPREEHGGMSLRGAMKG